MVMWLLGTCLISYILGSIPSGFILGKLFGYKDIRRIGSGNIGATNALRTGNKLLAVLTLLFDIVKGVLAVVICRYYYNDDYASLAALMVVLGHIFPVWLHFKGGKGVATAIGVFIAINFALAMVVCGLWFAVFIFTRISSISSLVSIGYSSIAAYLLDSYFTALLCLCIAALILFSHRSNIIRLLAGSEDKFSLHSIRNLKKS